MDDEPALNAKLISANRAILTEFSSNLTNFIIKVSLFFATWITLFSRLVAVLSGLIYNEQVLNSNVKYERQFAAMYASRARSELQAALSIMSLQMGFHLNK